MRLRTLDGMDLAGKTVLLRADFNVPLAMTDGAIVVTDDGRIRAALPTLTRLSAAGARVVIVSHLGRPKGVVDPALSLRPVAQRLAELTGRPVAFAETPTGIDASSTVKSLQDGGVGMLENIRFDPRETSKDPAQRAALAAELAALADVFVSDGFGVVHREQASVTDIARLLPSAAGDLVVEETQAFDRVLTDPERPYVVVLGGAKVSDKLGVIENLLARVDRLLIGGGMAFTFLAAQGHGVGDSLLEADQIPVVSGLLERAQELGVALVVPVDVVVAREFRADAQTQIVGADQIPSGWRGLDIGPRTTALYAEQLADARTIVWNGPMGVFEMPAFAEGTRAVATAIMNSTGTTVVGGGDSAAAIRLLGLDETRFTHLSTGGGASLELLEGRELPGLTVLQEA